MGKIKVRYYVVYHRSGHSAGYWKPSRTMREAGFALVNCGENGPAAWKIADGWNRRWDEFRKSGELARWPIGSVGAAFAAFRQTGVWHAKKPRTKEDWERGWKYIEEPFGDIEPQMIVLAQIDNWYRSIVVGKGVREGWRAMKIWRALWGAMVALGYCHKQDPSKRSDARHQRRALQFGGRGKL